MANGFITHQREMILSYYLEFLLCRAVVNRVQNCMLLNHLASVTLDIKI